MANALPTLPTLPRIYWFDIYTLSNNKAQYEPLEWNGIVDNNNSTISTTWVLDINGSDDGIYNFPADSGKTGTYKRYQVNPPSNIDSSYENIGDSSKAELTYWATTDYGGTKITAYFYYKKSAPEYTYRLYVKVNDVVQYTWGNLVGEIYSTIYGSTVHISLERKQTTSTTWYPTNIWKLKENLNISFSISNAKLTSTSSFQMNIGSIFNFHSGYPNDTYTNDNMSTNLKDSNISIGTETSFYSWESRPGLNNPSTASVELDGTTLTVDVVCDSSSNSDSGGGFQPGEGLQPIH